LMQTSGDITLKHWMKDIMLMSGDRPRTMMLAVPIFTEKMMDIVAKYIRLEWVTKFRLLTTDPIPYVVLKHFSEKVECDVNMLMERIELAAAISIPDGMMAFSGPDGTVVIQGRIYDTITPGLTLYTGMLGKTEGNGIRSIMEAWDAFFKARAYVVDEEKQDSQTSQKQTRKKRKEK